MNKINTGVDPKSVPCYTYSPARGVARYSSIQEATLSLGRGVGGGLRSNTLPKVVKSRGSHVLVDTIGSVKQCEELYVEITTPYVVKPVSGRGKVQRFATLDHLLKGLGIHIRSSGTDTVISRALEKGYIVTPNKYARARWRKYDLLNVVTGEEYLNVRVKDIIKITGQTATVVASRGASRVTYGVRMGDWVMKSVDDPKYGTQAPWRPISTKVHYADQEEVYESASAAVRATGISAYRQKKYNSPDKTVNGMWFEQVSGE